MGIKARVEVAQDNLLHRRLGLLAPVAVELAELPRELGPLVLPRLLALPVASDLLLKLLVRNIAQHIFHALLSVEEALLARADHFGENREQCPHGAADARVEGRRKLALLDRLAFLRSATASDSEVLANGHALLIGEAAGTRVGNPTVNTTTARIDPKHVLE